ncbi:MAG: redoxin domain-containing protein [Thermoplasmata archaeon]|nr:MAG: redoxin domain-containing protein [Thermoplasmata archaeon]
MVSKARALAGIVLILLGLALAMPTIVAEDVEKAPDIEFTDVDGVTFRLSDYRENNTVLVLDFMFLTCEPCKVLAHDLKDMYDGDDRNYEILSIDNVPSERAEDLKAYAEENDYHWRFTMDNDDQDGLRKYAITANPTIIIIDGDGFQTWRKTPKGVENIDIDDISHQIDLAISGEAVRQNPAQQLGLIAFAFIAGLAAFFSPCSFPLLPGYITYYFKVGADAAKKREEEGLEEKELTRSQQIRTGLRLGTISGLGIVLVYFVLGIIVIPLLFLGVTAVGDAIAYLGPVVGVILVVMGLLTLFDVAINTGYITAPFRWLRDKIRPPKGPRKPTFNTTGLFLYGVGYGSASAGCSAPIFIALVFAAVATGQAFDTVMTFTVFLFSLWLLMAVVSVVLTVSEEKVKTGMMKNYIWIKRVTGVVFVIAGAYLLYLFLEAEGYIRL